jgi:hypothetical protein
MAITTYNELKSAIANWVHRADLSAYLDDLVTLAEKRIMREVRATEMETALSDSIAAAGTMSAPSGFLGLKNAYVNTAPTTKLTVVSLSQLLTRYPQRTSDDVPQVIAYDAGTFHFGPFPDSTYTVKGTYYKRQGPLSSSVHDLFSNNPDLYLFAALAETEPFLKNDSRIQMWTAKYMSIRDAINTEAQGIGFAGGMAVTVA